MPYQIIHSHVHQFSGYVLWLAEKVGIPGRIVHSHLDTSYEDQNAALPRKLYLQTMRSCINAYATCGLAASSKSASALYGPFWQKDPRWRILYYGINLEPYRRLPLPDRHLLRDHLGLPSDAFVIGHVGIFKRQKNHRFLLRVATEVLLRLSRAYVVLVGDGPLRPEIEAAAKQAGIEDRVVFTGARDDVPNLLSIMDVFLFPSLWEGLPLALLEALAAGLPCVVSNAVTDEGDVVPQLVQRRSLSDPVSMWADTVLAWRTTPLPISQAEACALVSESAFSSSTSTQSLTELYESFFS
jgi:glycosyltransferase involved in cell wall biosynthesis